MLLLKFQKKICGKAGNEHQRLKTEIAQQDFLLQLMFIFVVQKRVADNKGCKCKENVQRKRIVGQNGIGKPVEIVFIGIQRRFRQASPANKPADFE